MSLDKAPAPESVSMRPRRIIVWGLVLLAMGTAAVVYQRSADTVNTAGLKIAPEAGALAPDFTLKTLAGGEITLSGLRGQAVLINFWASWCPPCRLEMPELVRAYNARKDEGFVILGIDLTFQDSLPDVQPFVDDFSIPFPILLDETGQVTNQLYRLVGLPMSVFVNRDGVIARVHVGIMTGDQIEQFVGELLD